MTPSTDAAGVGESAAKSEMAEAILGFLAEKLGATDCRIVSFSRSVEGFSWETYSIGVAWSADNGELERHFIVHRVPRAGMLAPYNTRAVYELRKALEGVPGVPVPAMLWIDEEGAATGRPLYVVEKLFGKAPTPWTSDTFFANDEERRQTARQLMEITAALHAAPMSIAPTGMRGLAEQDPLSEIDYWHRIYREECVEPVPAVDWGFAWLYAHSDRMSARRCVLHGDLRTGNYMMHGGRIIALLDWEEAHVGDPVQDLAHCAFRLFRGRTRQAAGLVPVSDLLAYYEEAADWEVSHEAFHFWSVYAAIYAAVTMHRANSIYASGATNDVRYAALGLQTHHTHRDLIDYIEAAERGAAPE